jgi:hypothetical protein
MDSGETTGLMVREMWKCGVDLLYHSIIKGFECVFCFALHVVIRDKICRAYYRRAASAALSVFRSLRTMVVTFTGNRCKIRATKPFPPTTMPETRVSNT